MGTKSKSPPRTYVLGRDRFSKISEVEGIRTSKEQDEDFKQFDRDRLSHAERRRILLKKYGRKS